MIHVAPIDESELAELTVVTNSETYLREMGYAVDGVEHYSVVSDSGSGYIVTKIETHTKPLALADAVADRYKLYVCSCKSYRYANGLPDLDQEHVTSWSACKHVKAVDKSIKAEADKDQTTL